MLHTKSACLLSRLSAVSARPSILQTVRLRVVPLQQHSMQRTGYSTAPCRAPRCRSLPTLIATEARRHIAISNSGRLGNAIISRVPSWLLIPATPIRAHHSGGRSSAVLQHRFFHSSPMQRVGPQRSQYDYQDDGSAFPARALACAAALTGVALVVFGPHGSKTTPSPLLVESADSNVELDSEADMEAYKGVQFAKSVEETESEEKRLHANPILRWMYVTSDAVQAYVLEPLGTTKRFLVLVFLFLPVILSAPMLAIGRRREGGRRRGRRLGKEEGGTRWGALWWYAFLVKQMERAGPTFIKLAQWAGSRQDLFPKELCDLLGKLHANGKPHPLAHTKKVIERVFGRPFDEVFLDFPDEPLGIGAVAQVYKATLRPDLLPPAYLEHKHTRTQASELSNQLALSSDDDRPPPAIPTASVAIKILHPKAHRTISRDIRIMSFFARLLNALPGAEWLSFPEEVDVFAEMMFSQLDLRNEAANLDRFESNFVKRGSAISFPRPLIAFTSKEILIEEYEDAMPLKYFLNLGGAGYDNRIANLGLDAFLSMLLLDNFTHADLHPGNIMIKFYRPTTKSLLRHLLTRVLSKFDPDYTQTTSSASIRKGKPETIDDQTDQSVVHALHAVRHDQDAWLDELDRLDALGYQPELVFLDAGLTVELTPENRRNFLDLFGAVAEFDGALAGHLMVERCRLPELVVDEDTFALKMQDLVLSVKSKTFSLAKIKIGDVLSQVLTAVREHHVKMEPDFVNTVISILLLEGIGRQLDPGMDLFKSALPILRNLGREMAMQDGGAGMLSHGQDLKNFSPMIKLWFWMEARSWLLGVADRATVDAFVRYDWLSTAA